MSTPSYSATYDPELARRTLSFNRRVTWAIVIAVCIAAFLGAIAATRPDVRWPLVGAAVAFAVCATLFTLPVLTSVRRKLSFLSVGEGTFASVDGTGLWLPGIGTTPWEHITAVVLMDASERFDRRARRPLLGWGVRTARRAGNGSRLLTVAFADGELVRSRIAHRAKEARIVRLWGVGKEGRRAGDITLLLDPLLSEDGVHRLESALVDAAEAARVAVYRASSQGEYFQTLGRVLDPRWPGATT